MTSKIYVIFVPQHNRDGDVYLYDIILINDTQYNWVYECELWLNGRCEIKETGVVKTNSKADFCKITFDDLNDSPKIEIAYQPVSTQGGGVWHNKTLKISPAHFFKRVHDDVPILRIPAHIYPIFDKLPAFEQSETLHEYTGKKQAEIQETKDESPAYYDVSPVNSPQHRAEFTLEKDLHIEKIAPHLAKSDNATILQFQMREFRTFIERAILLNIHRVYIIHGIGKGKLREEIHRELGKMKEIKSFKNEYHPKYGTGATEVEI